jgi:hypothetical protein
MQRIDISGHSDAEIDIVAELGGNVIVRGVVNDSGSDGSIYLMTLENDSDGYIAYPMAAGEKDVLLLPITHVRKSGSISSAIFKYQKINS